jgi:hypothetical protein
MRITGDNDDGKAQLDNFIDPESTFPVIATTSQLMSTGVDAQTCRLIVLDKRINSMTEFKQIIGRGTRMWYGKFFFTIMDFGGPRSFSPIEFRRIRFRFTSRSRASLPNWRRRGDKRCDRRGSGRRVPNRPAWRSAEAGGIGQRCRGCDRERARSVPGREGKLITESLGYPQNDPKAYIWVRS